MHFNIELANAINNNSSSSNSNSPISLSKISSTSTSGSGSLNSSRSKNRKVLPIKDREYDPEKHCGVRIGNMKPCTRSLTCKTHQISLRRNVEGRSKPFDQLLADHRNNAKESHKHSSSKQVNTLKAANICRKCGETTTEFELKIRFGHLLMVLVLFFHRPIICWEIIAINSYWTRLEIVIHRLALIWNDVVSPAIAINRQ